MPDEGAKPMPEQRAGTTLYGGKSADEILAEIEFTGHVHPNVVRDLLSELDRVKTAYGVALSFIPAGRYPAFVERRDALRSIDE